MGSYCTCIIFGVSPQSELVSQLYRKEEIETLLEESVHIAARRKEASEMLQVSLPSFYELIKVKVEKQYPGDISICWY